MPPFRKLTSLVLLVVLSAATLASGQVGGGGGGGTLQALTEKADAKARAGFSNQAVEIYLDALDYSRKYQAAAPLRAALFDSVAEVFMRAEFFSYAIPYFDSTLRYQPDNFAARERQGMAWMALGIVPEAEKTLQPVVKHLTQTGELVRVVDLYQKLAEASNRAGDPETGAGYYELIKGIVFQIGSPAEQIRVYNNLGYQYFLAGRTDEALRNLLIAQRLCEASPNECHNQELYLTNLGIVEHDLGHSERGIKHLLEARGHVVRRGDRGQEAKLEYLLANTYLATNDVYNALQHTESALGLARQTGQQQLRRDALKMATQLYLIVFDYEKAVGAYDEYTHLDDSLRQQAQRREHSLLGRQTDLERAEKSKKLALLEVALKRLAQDNTRKDSLNYDEARRRLDAENAQSKAVAMLAQSKQQVAQSQAEQLKFQLIAAQADKKRAEIAAQQFAVQKELDADRKQRLLDSIGHESQTRQLDLSTQRLAVQQLQLDQSSTKLQYMTWLGLLGILVVGLLAIGFILSRRNGRRLSEQKKAVEAAQAQSEELLHNILPEEIAAELKANGEATPRLYEAATVLFTDFVNFSKLAEKLSPDQLIAELNECFLAFDLIIDKYGLEKIKTIGDAYMCAGGLPVPSNTHPQDAVQAAVEMLAWLESRNRGNSSAVLQHMRVGIHTGPVIAGVVGKNKFAYDIWGDAVNLAARLEEHGTPGKINISAATFELVKDRFNCLHQGKREVYNKGLVDMYFVESK